MRSTFTIVSVFLAGLFLFSVLTPEPSEAQGYEGNVIPVFVEGDAAFALCSSPVVTSEHQPQLGYLPFVEQVFSVPTFTISSNCYRGPPLLSFLP